MYQEDWGQLSRSRQNSSFSDDNRDRCCCVSPTSIVTCVLAASLASISLIMLSISCNSPAALASLLSVIVVVRGGQNNDCFTINVDPLITITIIMNFVVV